MTDIVEYQQKINNLKRFLGNREDEFKVDIVEETYEKPWYFLNGTKFPNPAEVDGTTRKRIGKLTPSESFGETRITDQLMFVPPNYEKIKQEGKLKKILLYNGLLAWNVEKGSS